MIMTLKERYNELKAIRDTKYQEYCKAFIEAHNASLDLYVEKYANVTKYYKTRKITSIEPDYITRYNPYSATPENFKVTVEGSDKVYTTSWINIYITNSDGIKQVCAF